MSRPLTPADVPVYSQADLDRAVAAERGRWAARLAELHKPHGIYDERDCLVYSVCRECCAGEGHAEACAGGHLHGRGLPICSTAAIVADLIGDQP